MRITGVTGYNAKGVPEEIDLSHLRFIHFDGKIEIAVRNGQVEVRATYDPLVILPGASNVVTVKAGDRP